MTIISKHIFYKTGHELDELLFSNPSLLTDEYKFSFTEQRFKASETGVSRRDLSVWHREDLLPFDPGGNKWGLYSLVECIWLRFVQKLKKFGFDNAMIILLKNQLFETNPSIFLANLEKMLIDANISTSEALKEKIDTSRAIIDKDPISAEAELKAKRISLFGILVMNTILSHSQNAMLINEDAEHAVVNLGKPLNKTQKQNSEAIMRGLLFQSYICINIQQLCANFFDNELLKVDNTFYWGIMNHKERQLLSDIHSDKYRLVTVTVADGSITHLKTTKRQKENEEMIKKLSRLFKKGQYVSIELTTNDGNIVKYEETEVTKF